MSGATVFIDYPCRVLRQTMSNAETALADWGGWHCEAAESIEFWRDEGTAFPSLPCMAKSGILRDLAGNFYVTTGVLRESPQQREAHL